MEEKQIRLIGLDLDGTTLTTDKRLTPHTKAVLEECIRRGIVILPSTGRVLTGIPDYLRDIQGIRYVITSNGGAVVDLQEDKVVYENGISWERALELCDIFEKYDTFYDIYSMGHGWTEGRFYDHLDRYHIDKHALGIVLMTRSRIEDLRSFIREHKRPIEKFNMFFAREADRLKAYRELQEIPDIEVTYSLSNNLEINHSTCNKGDALLGLARILSIAQEETMACGDGLNDISMIEKAGTGVAMGNAMEEVLAVADYVTRTNDEEGVAYAIEHFCRLSVE